jgi:hypothetical protein
MMKQFDKPTNLNGAELLAELKAAGIKATKIIQNGNRNIEIDLDDEAKAKPIIEAHNGTVIPPEPTVEEKLASVGLNLTDLKTALGI